MAHTDDAPCDAARMPRTADKRHRRLHGARRGQTERGGRRERRGPAPDWPPTAQSELQRPPLFSCSHGQATWADRRFSYLLAYWIHCVFLSTLHHMALVWPGALG
jgi:hypothetical protein